MHIWIKRRQKLKVEKYIFTTFIYEIKNECDRKKTNYLDAFFYLFSQEKNI